jgi:hypothetical protein
VPENKEKYKLTGLILTLMLLRRIRKRATQEILRKFGLPITVKCLYFQQKKTGDFEVCNRKMNLLYKVETGVSMKF